MYLNKMGGFLIIFLISLIATLDVFKVLKL